MCKFLKVSRSGYYEFIKRMDKPSKDLELHELIHRCQIETKQTYGYRRVTIWLELKGYHYNPKTVLRVMNKYNLLSVVRRKKFHNCSLIYCKYDNIINRQFLATRPNEKWVTDTSYIKTSQGFLYVSVIVDLYDLSVVAHKTSTAHNVNLVLDTVKAAKKKEKVTGKLYLHSDQGFQYTSKEYFELTKSYNITQSMSRQGNPYDNALAKNFFSMLKTECINRIKIETIAEAKQLVDEYIYFYNFNEYSLKQK